MQNAHFCSHSAPYHFHHPDHCPNKSNAKVAEEGILPGLGNIGYNNNNIQRLYKYLDTYENSFLIEFVAVSEQQKLACRYHLRDIIQQRVSSSVNVILRFSQ